MNPVVSIRKAMALGKRKRRQAKAPAFTHLQLGVYRLVINGAAPDLTAEFHATPTHYAATVGPEAA